MAEQKMSSKEKISSQQLKKKRKSQWGVLLYDIKNIWPSFQQKSGYGHFFHNLGL